MLQTSLQLKEALYRELTGLVQDSGPYFRILIIALLVHLAIKVKYATSVLERFDRRKKKNAKEQVHEPKQASSVETQEMPSLRQGRRRHDFNQPANDLRTGTILPGPSHQTSRLSKSDSQEEGERGAGTGSTRRLTFWELAKQAQAAIKNPNKIAIAAFLAVKAPGFATHPGMCQQWVRQVVQKVCGVRFDYFWYRISARGSYDAFLGTHYVVKNGSLPGDILYFIGPEHGEFGHVVIRIYGNLCAENSSRYGRSSKDARGVIPLSELGTPDLVVRLI